MQQISMTLLDPEKRSIIGMPNQQPSAGNPFYQATEFERMGDRKTAEKIYLELLNNDFDNPVLHAALGMNYAVAEKNGLACLLLRKSLDNIKGMTEGFKRLGITPKNPTQPSDFLNIKHSEVLNAIGTCYKHENDTETARRYFLEAQARVPPNADIQNNIATLSINEGKPETALKHLDTALSLDKDHAQAHWNKSLCLLEMGDYINGWKEYDWGLKANVRIDRNYTKAPIPFWDGSKGKKIVVYGEQGIGDEILFASMLGELIKDSESVVFDCHKKLHKLFAASFPTIDIYPTREDENLSWPVNPNGSLRYQFDAKVAIGSLGNFYRPDLSTFPGTPYIKPSTGSEAEWALRLSKLPDRPRVGISWIGGHKRTRIEVRSIALKQLLPILKQDATFISLQYTPCEAELAAFEREHEIKIHHFPEACYSPIYDDKAGLVANLDLVITVCTSLVHLAGSMGVPTWVMTPSRPAWRYRLDMDTMPWYSSVVLFRQASDSTDWTPVIQEVAGNLSNLLAGTTK